MNGRDYANGTGVFLLALLGRILAVVVTAITNLNPYTQQDARDFAAAAHEIAEQLTNGVLPVVSSGNIFEVWGAMLSPFWILPGPNVTYARVGMALLGALAAYNIYAIARNLHSQQAGLIAVIPLLCYPSFVLTHASVLREAAVLFGLTTTARLLIVPSKRLSRPVQYVAVGLALYITIILRTDNLPVYALVLGAGIALSIRPIRRYLRRRPRVVGAGVAGLAIASFPYLSHVIDYLANVRQGRATGRTEYLGWVFPDTILEAIAFSWIGAVYFLFTPFPWMIGTVSDLIVAGEAFVNLLFAIFAILGARYLIHRRPAVTMALVVGIILGSVLYGFGTANFGTAVRHRQMVLWAIFILGGIGFANKFDLRVPSMGSRAGPDAD